MPQTALRTALNAAAAAAAAPSGFTMELHPKLFSIVVFGFNETLKHSPVKSVRWLFRKCFILVRVAEHPGPDTNI